MFRHSIEPQRLDGLSIEHPLRGIDLRTLSDGRLADAAARALIPEWGRLWQHLDHGNSDHAELIGVSSSILQRVTRVILHSTRVTAMTEPNDYTLERLDELLEATTLAFIQMVGAFDALAVVNGLLSGQTRYPGMAWQQRQFRDAVRAVSPRAAQLMDPGVPGDLYFRAIRAFRNTIHRRMPDVGSSGRDGGDPAHNKAILLLDSNGHQEIIAAFIAAGWTRFIGVEVVGGYLFLRPATAVGLLESEGIPLLNALMEATPIEQLGPARPAIDPSATLYPRQMQEYAVEYLRLKHLLSRSTG